VLEKKVSFPNKEIIQISIPSRGHDHICAIVLSDGTVKTIDLKSGSEQSVPTEKCTSLSWDKAGTTLWLAQNDNSVGRYTVSNSSLEIFQAIQADDIVDGNFKRTLLHYHCTIIR
jgi:hypothetical protein